MRKYHIEQQSRSPVSDHTTAAYRV